jgi:hypothetical protein
MEDSEYRNLVEQVDLLDEEKRERFPEAFTSHKDFQKKIQQMRKQLHREDPFYKEILFANFRAKRALEEYLLDQIPSIANQPNSRKKAFLEKARIKYQSNANYRKLVKIVEDTQKKLEENYPELFLSSKEISNKREQARKSLNDIPAFKRLMNKRSDAYNTKQDYLYDKDKRLTELRKRMDND